MKLDETSLRAGDGGRRYLCFESMIVELVLTLNHFVFALNARELGCITAHRYGVKNKMDCRTWMLLASEALLVLDASKALVVRDVSNAWRL